MVTFDARWLIPFNYNNERGKAMFVKLIGKSMRGVFALASNQKAVRYGKLKWKGGTYALFVELPGAR